MSKQVPAIALGWLVSLSVTGMEIAFLLRRLNGQVMETIGSVNQNHGSMLMVKAQEAGE